MKHLHLKTLGLAAILCTGSGSIHALAPQSFLGRQFSAQHHGRQFRGIKPLSIEPAHSFTGLPYYDYLEGPDGTTWFYTAEYRVETVQHNPFWSEDLIKGFTFTVYDNAFNVVGTISDDVEFEANETRAKEIVLDPTISTHFFNTDDNPEVMVFFAMNTEEYVNHYYNKIYSLGGEKDVNGHDVSIATYEGRCIDATNATAPQGDENFFFTFVKDPVVEENMEQQLPHDEYVDYLNGKTYDLTTYAKTSGAEGPKAVFEYQVYSTRVPGDTAEGVYLITKTFGNELYFIYSQYEKPYFIDPTGGATNEAATPGNSLVIENYRMSDTGAELLSTTKIPVDDPSTADALIYSFYSIGSVGWSNDVDMIVNGTPSAPAFVVANDVANAATLEDMASNYYIFSNSGTPVRTLAADTESILVYDTPQGEEPQALFIKNTDGDYTFEVGNLYSGTVVFNIPQTNGGDPLTVNGARATGNDGKYMYVFEMADDMVDDAYNRFARVAWIGADGIVDHIDNINLGTDVQAYTVNLSSDVLDAHLYDNDDAMEYAVLVKRNMLTTTRNEFIVVDDDGTNYIKFSADDYMGDPYMFTILPGDTNRLMMVYTDFGNYNIRLYDLPFTEKQNSINNVTADGNTAFDYDGATINAANSRIDVYNTLGIMVASGHNNVSTAELGSGIYMVVTTDVSGKKSASKISVK